jgi:hypothetical protein
MHQDRARCESRRRFPGNSHDPIVYPVAATVNAKPGTMQYLAFSAVCGDQSGW